MLRTQIFIRKFMCVVGISFSQNSFSLDRVSFLKRGRKSKNPGKMCKSVNYFLLHPRMILALKLQSMERHLPNGRSKSNVGDVLIVSGERRRMNCKNWIRKPPAFSTLFCRHGNKHSERAKMFICFILMAQIPPCMHLCIERFVNFFCLNIKLRHASLCLRKYFLWFRVEVVVVKEAIYWNANNNNESASCVQNNDLWKIPKTSNSFANRNSFLVLSFQ